MITDPTAVFVVLAGVVYAALQLERHFVVFRALGSALVAILVAMALSNLGVIPGTSPTYGLLAGPGVSAAVVLILLGVDARSVVRAGPRMLAAFGLGAVGTAVGASLAWVSVGQSVGPEAWKLAGQYTGTYTGGGMNFAALARELETSPDLFSAAVAADVAITAVWLIACLSIPVLLDRARGAGSGEEGSGAEVPGATAAAAPVRGDEASTSAGEDKPPVTDGGPTGPPDGHLGHSLASSVRPVSLADAAALVTLAVGIVWFAGWLAGRIPGIPEVLLLTTIVLLLAQVPALERLAGGAMAGNYLLHLFLAANGAQSVIANIFAIGPAVFWFATITVTIHGLVIFGCGRLAGIDAATLAVASQANVGGPASAMALAGARGYTERLLPGIAVGLLGYAIGNYSGFVIATLARSLG